jgi:hypothetical protein
MSKTRLELLLIIALVLGGTVSAKCPTGSVTVHGRVENLPSAVTGAEVAVVLETPKGNASKAASITNGEFTVEVSFSTVEFIVSGWRPVPQRANGLGS